MNRKSSITKTLICLLSIIITSMGFISPSFASDTPGDFFKCGGQLEHDTWRVWDDFGREYVKRDLIENRLVEKGDTYSLYDFEIGFHNLLAMAQRCARTDRSLEIARIIDSSYSALDASTKSWICRGGATCNDQNKLLGREVMLNSAQFLAFASSAADGLGSDQSIWATDFSKRTVNVVVEHLVRWTTTISDDSIRRRVAAKPESVRDGSSALFFTDRDLWQIVIYTHLAGIIQQRPDLKVLLGSADQVSRLKTRYELLLTLFKARTAVLPSTGKGDTAELDRGFWRLYADSRYAGYTGEEEPVYCARDDDGKSPLRNTDVITRKDAPQPSSSLGWDFSHARRLVHLLDAVDRNREAVELVFPGLGSDLPSDSVLGSYARQIRLNVWNQDVSYPLFTNFFNGENGWYRVAYDNKTGRCRVGVPPFGLSASFLSGGYASWGDKEPKLALIAQRLYFLTQSDAQKDTQFIQKYYPLYSTRGTQKARETMQILFWPTLISD